MKPEEAKKKWCPMHKRCDLCVADLCAVWVWHILPHTGERFADHPVDGHCGLVKK